mmetsp:Transcript_6280/g.17059  ORF Transcript_6280/g.17059 Transcript_6280/m.17059 type:complete len:224 (-) Transcript_6280:50-721(-)
MPPHSFSSNHTSRSYLELAEEGIQCLDGLGGGSESGVLLLVSGSTSNSLDGLEEVVCGLLLLDGLGKSADGESGLVHVTAELVSDLEPLLLFDVGWELLQSDARLGEDGLLAVDISASAWLVEGVLAGLSVDGVWGVDLGGLVTSVCGTLGVGGSVSDESEDGESWGFTGSGVGGNWNEGGSGGNDAREGLTARFLRKGSGRGDKGCEESDLHDGKQFEYDVM